jgi:hypothetical protein
MIRTCAEATLPAQNVLTGDDSETAGRNAKIANESNLNLKDKNIVVPP